MNNYFITIFTPTYNRAKLLNRLYTSLLLQDFVNFEWLIIDDGSTDDTLCIVSNFIADKKIPIRYLAVENRGKQQAINTGVQLSYGELFFIVDSDDILPPHSLKYIWDNYQHIRYDNSIAGVAGLKGDLSFNQIGGKQLFENVTCSPQFIRYKLKLKGDMAEIIKTSILKEFPFPYFENETFCSEALIWFRIGRKYKFYYFNKIIYQCEYLQDGLTRNIASHYINSPKSSMLYYRELMNDDMSHNLRIRAAVNYWRYSYHLPLKRIKEFKPLPWMWFFLPFGIFFGIIDIIRKRYNT